MCFAAQKAHPKGLVENILPALIKLYPKMFCLFSIVFVVFIIFKSRLLKKYKLLWTEIKIIAFNIVSGRRQYSPVKLYKKLLKQAIFHENIPSLLQPPILFSIF